jgi:L-alanine-DL-glutamate epimerase-like enolase superfamily enzyme
VKTAADVITVTVEEGGIAGRGEGVPYPRYGESVETSLAAIEAARAALEGGAGRQALQSLLPPGAARNAVDCALWDLEARRSGVGVAALAGLQVPGRLVSAITLGIDAPEAMARLAALHSKAPLLKVKVDSEDPAARIRAVRAAAPGAALIVDPNESWDQRLLEDMQAVLLEAEVDLVEQPVPADSDSWLAGFVPAVPICADEAVHVAADLDRIALRYQGVNVKLDKTGGLTEALALRDEARALGFGVMVGCMVGTSLAMAPAVLLAQGAAVADLDGPLLLAEDRPAPLRYDDRGVHPSDPELWG